MEFHNKLTDQGKNLQSVLLELIYEYLDIKRLRTTPYNPQCDGQSERFIHTAKQMITSYVDETHTIGMNILQSLRTIVQFRISPFEMRFGQTPRIPCEIVFCPETAARLRIIYEDHIQNNAK